MWKIVIFQGLSREFSKLSLTHQKSLFYTFSDKTHPPPPHKSQKAPKKLKKTCIFGQISNSSLIMYPLPLSMLGLSFTFYCLVVIEVRVQPKFPFQSLHLFKVMEEKLFGGSTYYWYEKG